jgi:uncharacterized membrane protein HdeD (DUF308 family)
MNVEAQLREGERMLAHFWKVTAVRGVLAIVFAVVILVWPSIGLAALIALFGALALISGVGTIYWAVRLPVERGQRIWLLIEGLLGIGVGVVVFLWPDLSALGLLYAIAAWAIAIGLFETGLAFGLPLGRRQALLLGLGGLLSIAFGVVMFAEPGAGALALLGLIAAFALVTGIMQIALSIELRRALGELADGPRPRATAKPVTHA